MTMGSLALASEVAGGSSVLRARVYIVAPACLLAINVGDDTERAIILITNERPAVRAVLR